jgi:hypothetical protein
VFLWIARTPKERNLSFFRRRGNYPVGEVSGYSLHWPTQASQLVNPSKSEPLVTKKKTELSKAVNPGTKRRNPDFVSSSFHVPKKVNLRFDMDRLNECVEAAEKQDEG